MSKRMTKKDALLMLQRALEGLKQYPSNLKDYFNIAAWYMEQFHIFLSQFPLVDNDEITEYASEHFSNALTLSFKNICKVLDKHEIDGSRIYRIIENETFILRKDRKEYNRQVPGKYPKGITQEEWQNYNHWLLTKIYWDAILWSFDAEFERLVAAVAAEGADFPITNKMKPLWAMWLRGLEAEVPPIGDKGDCISIYPHACFVTYFGWKKIKVYKKSGDI